MKRTPASRNIALAFLALFAVAGFSGKADAAVNGYLSKTVTLRAGPDKHFPALVKVSGKPGVVVYGCTTNNWCDVGLQGARGWIQGKDIVAVYRGNDRRPVLTYREQLGLPIVAFQQVDYWNQYYPTYSFYRDQAYWTHGERFDNRSNRYVIYRNGPDGHFDGRYDNRYDNRDDHNWDNDRWDNGHNDHDGHYNR